MEVANGMYKCMIIDDEKLIISDLLHMIDWKSHGFEIVATACNGKQGLLKYREFRPHIIFTDIKMPIMDGLEMLQEIRSQDISTRFVILTAFSEFDYVKQALELGACAYVLKNELTPESLFKTLDTVESELFERSKITLLTIESNIRTFLEGDRQNTKETMQHLELAFNTYPGGQTNLRALIRVVGNLIEQDFIRNDKITFFEPPPELKLELLEWIGVHLERIARWARDAESHTSPVISRAQVYIENNYRNRDLNIQMISDDSAISPSWLSVRFHKETNQTINEYITDARVKAAKRLLRQGNYKVYEIAEMIGYGSSRYFSKVFFQATGHSPQTFAGLKEAVN
jgi:two-component system response regulator YesN